MQVHWHFYGIRRHTCFNPNLEDQETRFVGPLTIDQPGMRDPMFVERTLPSIAQWAAEVHKSSHHGKVQSLHDHLRGRWSSGMTLPSDSPPRKHSSGRARCAYHLVDQAMEAPGDSDSPRAGVHDKPNR
ncbi:hypothetical protein CSKR_108261 [Clonorchis sinensis]|uniref:Uncharacterized protein n=1 Tax=Clonorchis sinensis TaxID=79923 RepID=A0A3R7FJD5_CLOSI|nr:hypothetical protein CSKR_108261 [Clonorchis sinensis]